MPTLHIDKLKTNEVNSTGNLVLMANGSKFITLNNASNNVEFHANVDANSFDFTDIDVIVGNIDNTPIGLNQQAQGKFSSLTAVGNTFAQGNLTVSGHSQLSGGLLVNSAATFNNEVTFNASATFADFDVSDLNCSTINVEANATIDGNAVVGGSLQCSGGLTVNSTAVFNNPITVANELTVSSGGELDVAAGTLTLANDSISGDAINGGTIGSIRIEQLSGAMDCQNNAMTNVNVDSGAIDGCNITVGSSKTLNVTGGTITLAPAQAVSVKQTLYSKAIPHNEGTHSADKVLTASQLLNRLWRGVPNAARNLTFPTAASLVAAMPDCVVGSTLEFTIMNLATSGSKDYTVISGAGMNLVSSGTGDHNKVKTKKAKSFLIEITNITGSSEGYNVYVLGDSTPI